MWQMLAKLGGYILTGWLTDMLVFRLSKKEPPEKVEGKTEHKSNLGTGAAGVSVDKPKKIATD